MKMVADGHQERLGGEKIIVLLAGEETESDQIGHIVHAVDVLPDPEQRLQIAKPALAFLYIGFDHVALAALFAVPLRPLGKFRLDEIRRRVAEEILFQLFIQRPGQRLVTDQKAVLQQCRADRVVVPAETDAILHTARGMTDFHV